MILLTTLSDICSFSIYCLNYLSIYKPTDLQSTNNILQHAILLKENLTELNNVIYRNYPCSPLYYQGLWWQNRRFWQDGLTDAQRFHFLSFYEEQNYWINNITYTINSWGRCFDIRYILRGYLQAMDYSFEFFTEHVLCIKFTPNFYDNTKYRYCFSSWFDPYIEPKPLVKREYIRFFNSYNEGRFFIERSINEIPNTESSTWLPKYTLIALGAITLFKASFYLLSC